MTEQEFIAVMTEDGFTRQYAEAMWAIRPTEQGEGERCSGFGKDEEDTNICAHWVRENNTQFLTAMKAAGKLPEMRALHILEPEITDMKGEQTDALEQTDPDSHRP